MQWIIREDGEGFRGPIDLFGTRQYNWFMGLCCALSFNSKSKIATEDDQNFMERKKIERGE